MTESEGVCGCIVVHVYAVIPGLEKFLGEEFIQVHIFARYCMLNSRRRHVG